MIISTTTITALLAVILTTGATLTLLVFKLLREQEIHINALEDQIQQLGRPKGACAEGCRCKPKGLFNRDTL